MFGYARRTRFPICNDKREALGHAGVIATLLDADVKLGTSEMIVYGGGPIED